MKNNIKTPVKLVFNRPMHSYKISKCFKILGMLKNLFDIEISKLHITTKKTERYTVNL